MKHGAPVSSHQENRSVKNAVEAINLRKSFNLTKAVRDVSIAIPEGSIHGILGPNGAGKTTTLRMILGIIDPDEGQRFLLGKSNPAEVAREIGYLPEERGLYPTMKAADVISFMGATRGMRFAEARKQGIKLLEEYGMGHVAEKQIRKLSKGMAQTVQILGTLVHEPRLVVLDEPFSGLDAINQERLEHLIRDLTLNGTTVLFSTHVIAHAERLCQNISIIAGGRVPFTGSVDKARSLMGSKVRLETLTGGGAWQAHLPEDVAHAKTEIGHAWTFEMAQQKGETIEPFLQSLISDGAGILSISVERADLHEAFVHIAGKAAADAMSEDNSGS